jgi:hypothetical protein
LWIATRREDLMAGSSPINPFWKYPRANTRVSLFQQRYPSNLHFCCSGESRVWEISTLLLPGSDIFPRFPRIVCAKIYLKTAISSRDLWWNFVFKLYWVRYSRPSFASICSDRLNFESWSRIQNIYGFNCGRKADPSAVSLDVKVNAKYQT